MYRIVKVEPLEHYCLTLTFADGVQGTVDLSHLAGRGVFAHWNDYDLFRQVRIGDTGELVWSDEVDLCPDALYLQVTGKKAEDLFPGLQRELTLPEISRFFGIVIKMFWHDHNPPHFHAFYAGEEALIDITSLSVFAGHLSPRALGLVIEWATLHQQELQADWDCASTQMPLQKIEPLQ